MTINYAQIFQSGLDKKLEQELVTGWMTVNASRVKYNGGDTVRIAKISMDALGDYDRATGYPAGAVGLDWETFTFTHDRGRKFNIDAMDVDETNFVLTAPVVMGEFVRTQVSPEVDLVRIAKIAGMNGVKTVEMDDAAGTTVLGQLKEGYAYLRDKGVKGRLITHIGYEALTRLETESAKQLTAMTFKVNGIETQVPAIDGNPLIPTVSGRMYDRIDKNNSTKVISPHASANALDALIVGEDIPLAIAKHAPARTFTPEQNKDADAYVINYRLYHDLWVEDNKVDGIYVIKKKVIENHVKVEPTILFTDTDSSSTVTATDTFKLTIKLTNNSDIALSAITFKDDVFKFNETAAALAKEANISKNKTVTIDSTILAAGNLNTVIKIDAAEFSKPLYFPVDLDFEDYPE